MTNIYCSNKLSKFLNLGKLDYSPEIASENWNAHIFEIGNENYIILMEENSLYSVVIPNFEIDDFENLQTIFLESILTQLNNDRIATEENIRAVKFTNAIVNVHPGLNDKRSPNIIYNIIYKLKSVYEEKHNIRDLKKYIGKNMNEIPWKIIKYNFPKELFKLKQNQR